MSDEDKTPVNRPARKSAEIKTVEAWAEEKGFLPQFAAGTPGQNRGGVAIAGTVGRANPEFWKYNAARALKAWVVGVELTEAEFDAAIAAAVGVEHR